MKCLKLNKCINSNFENIFFQKKVCFTLAYLSLGHQRPHNFPATEVEECGTEDTSADEQQVRRRAVDCQCSSGKCHDTQDDS